MGGGLEVFLGGEVGGEEAVSGVGEYEEEEDGEEKQEDD